MENNYIIKAKKIATIDLTHKERLKRLVDIVSKLNLSLHTANTDADANRALNNLSVVIDELSRQSCFSEIRFEDLRGTIRSVKLHDVTRSDLYAFAEKFIAYINGLILEEEKKERVQAFRALCLQLAEHAEEVVNVIDTTKIFD